VSPILIDRNACESMKAAAKALLTWATRKLAEFEPPVNNAEAPGGQDEPKGNGTDHAARLKSMRDSARKAYLGFQIAEKRAGHRLQDREAYHWLEDDGPPDLDGLPSFDTWARHLRSARNILGEQKNVRRAGRTARSVVRLDEI